MLAFVLSGAANFGAMQVGGLEVLFKSGIAPDIVVGTSAGSLNAVHIASNPTLSGIRQLRVAWEEVREDQVGKPSFITGLSRVITGQISLFVNEPLAQFFVEHLPPNTETFGQLADLHGIRAYTTAVCLETGQLALFGDKEDDRLIDGVMASTAIPPVFPPWEAGKKRYIDGGVVAKLPLRAAVERGATQIIAFDVINAMSSSRKATNIFGISSYAISLMADHLNKESVDWVRRQGVQLRIIKLEAPPQVAFWDYSQAGYLYKLGYQIVQKELERKPIHISSGWGTRIRQGVSRFVNQSLAY